MKLYDITHSLSTATACWPGDEPFSFTFTARIAGGDLVNLSKLSMSPHVGTHADSPFHYDEGALPMDKVPLERYIGPARVIALEGRDLIRRADIEPLALTGVERLLVKTGSCPDATQFNPAFTAFDADAVRYLAGIGVRLIGTDAHSVDPFTSENLAAHKACADTGVLILENLNLTGVPPGDYELIALPLKLAGADGSPVRAVLRTDR